MAPIHVAAEKGRLQKVKYIADADSSAVHARDGDENTPLHYAAYGGHAHVIKELLRRGADVDARNEYGYTPLMLAAYNGHLAAALALLAHGADPKARSGYDNGNALYYAKGLKNNQWEAVAAALEALAEMTAEDRKKAAKAWLGELDWTPEDHRLFPPVARAAAMLIVYRFGSLEVDFLNGPGLLVAQYAAKEAVKEVLQPEEEEARKRLEMKLGRKVGGRSEEAWLAIDRVVGGPAACLARLQAHS